MGSKRQASAATPAVRALRQQGVAFHLHADDFHGLEAGIALEAAALIGVTPGRVLKTLMAAVDHELVVTLVPADRDLDLKSLANAVGGKRAVMADLRQPERASGYVKGGISPFGQRRQAPAVVDNSALEHESVFVNGAAGGGWRSSSRPGI